MQIISELEDQARLLRGAIGYFGFDGNLVRASRCVARC